MFVNNDTATLCELLLNCFDTVMYMYYITDQDGICFPKLKEYVWTDV